MNSRVGRMLHFFVAISFIVPLNRAEVLNIGRFLGKNGTLSSDWIKISHGSCTSLGQANLCKIFGSYWKATPDKNLCFCQCPLENATFGYYDLKWHCKKNHEVRNLNMRESPAILFNKENPFDPLSALDYGQERMLKFERKLDIFRSCPSVREVRYLRCNGSWSEPKEELNRVFSVNQQRSNRIKYHLKVIGRQSNNTLPVISGKVLKLVLTFGCVLRTKQFRTLVLKFQGVQQCQGDIQFATPSQINAKLAWINNPTTAVRVFLPTSNTSINLYREQSENGDSRSSASALTIALPITASIILATLAVVMCLFRRRRQKIGKGKKCVVSAPSNPETGLKADGNFKPNQAQLKKLSGPGGMLNDAFLGDGFFHGNQTRNGLCADGARSQTAMIFEPCGQIAIDINYDKGQNWNSLALSNYMSEEEQQSYYPNAMKEMDEQIYVNVSSNPDNYSRYHTELNDDEARSYSWKEGDEISPSPPVPKRTCSLENVEDKSRSSAFVSKVISDESVKGVSKGLQSKLFSSDANGLSLHDEQTEATFDAREKPLQPSTDQVVERTPYGCGLPLPSPPPPTPPTRSLSLDSLDHQKGNFFYPDGLVADNANLTTGDVTTISQDEDSKRASDDEGLYTYATSEITRNSLAFLNDSTATYYGERNNSDDSDEAVCKMEPCGPNYVVLEPGETQVKSCLTGEIAAVDNSVPNSLLCQSKLDSEVNVYQSLVQNGLDKYYTIQRTALTYT